MIFQVETKGQGGRGRVWRWLKRQMREMPEMRPMGPLDEFDGRESSGQVPARLGDKLSQGRKDPAVRGDSRPRAAPKVAERAERLPRECPVSCLTASGGGKNGPDSSSTSGR
jgi:hypothetical protein